MLFSEVYGTYYNVLAALLRKAQTGTLTQAELHRTVREKGFEESLLTIPENLASEVWPLITQDMTTPLQHLPTQPLTTLQKRWMKTLLQDPRIRLFDLPEEGLEDVEPLYPSGSVVYFDRYDDADPYEDPVYIGNFRTVLAALREKRQLQITYRNRFGSLHSRILLPHRLEYSPKDDKFRLIAGSGAGVHRLNLARIEACSLGDPQLPPDIPGEPQPKSTLVLELTDHRNTLERCMLHFSHLEKQAEKLGENRYRLTLQYEKEDETELLIRVLSFGPTVEAVSPPGFRQQLRQRIQKQQHLSTPE